MPVETYWATCHPELDADDDDDPTMRVNAVLGLADVSSMLPALRLAPLTRSQAFGAANMRTVEIADGDLLPVEGLDTVLDKAGISAAFQDTPDDVLAEISSALQAAQENIGRIDAVFNEKTPGRGPNLEPATAWLKRASKVMAREMATDDVEEDALENDAPVANGAGGPARSAGGGAISTPADVRHTLERLIDYYKRHEPSSPIPILLERAKRLVGADFLTIVKDIAPGGVDNVNTVGGIEEEGY